MRGCHGWIESHRAVAYENGWLVRSARDLVVGRVPVWLHGSLYPTGWFMLNDEGVVKWLWWEDIGKPERPDAMPPWATPRRARRP